MATQQAPIIVPPDTSTPTVPKTGIVSASKLPWENDATVPTPPEAATATPGLVASTTSATPSSVNPNALSEQVNKVADPNSEISRRAAALANEESNSKGLLNSSMAIGAAHNAVLQAALPIAQGDVQAQELNASNEQQASLQNAQQTNAVATVNAQSTTQANLADAAAKNTQIMSQLDQANKVQLAGINTQYQSFLNSSGAASSLFNNTMQQISTIQNNPNLDASHKTDAINQLTSLLQSGLESMSAINGLDLTQGLDFGAVSKNATSTETSDIQKQLDDLKAQIKKQQTPYPSDSSGGA
jgi:hypothetical protein